MEQIDVRDAKFAGRGSRRACVRLEPGVILCAARQVGCFQILMRNRAEQHDPRGGLAVRLKRTERVYKLGKTFAVRIRLLNPCVRFVVSKKRENDVRLDVAQNLGIRRNPLASWQRINPVSAHAHVADSDLLLLQCSLQNCFKPSVLVHPVGKRVPNERDGVTFLKCEFLGRRSVSAVRALSGLTSIRSTRLRMVVCGLGSLRITNRRSRLRGILRLLGLRFARLRRRHIVVSGDRRRQVSVDSGLDAFRMASASERVRLVRTDKTDVRVGFDLLLQTNRPVHRVHKHPAVSRIQDVLGGAIKARKDTRFDTVFRRVSPRPFAGHRFFGVVRWSSRFHAVERLGHRQDVPVLGGLRRVAARLDVNIADTAQDRVG